MQIVIDSNVLFSALIKNSVTRKIILDYDGLFLFPSYIFEELSNHKEELLSRSKMDTQQFNQLLGIILSKVVIVSSKVLENHKEKALEIVNYIDINDVLFFACALAYPDSVIWSNDKELKRQNKIRILNTKELLKELS